MYTGIFLKLSFKRKDTKVAKLLFKALEKILSTNGSEAWKILELAMW